MTTTISIDTQHSGDTVRVTTSFAPELHAQPHSYVIEPGVKRELHIYEGVTLMLDVVPVRPAPTTPDPKADIGVKDVAEAEVISQEFDEPMPAEALLAQERKRAFEASSTHTWRGSDASKPLGVGPVPSEDYLAEQVDAFPPPSPKDRAKFDECRDDAERKVRDTVR